MWRKFYPYYNDANNADIKTYQLLVSSLYHNGVVLSNEFAWRAIVGYNDDSRGLLFAKKISCYLANYIKE